MREKRYITRSALEKMSIPEWLHFLKLCEKFEYIVTDDNGIIIK